MTALVQDRPAKNPAPSATPLKRAKRSHATRWVAFVALVISFSAFLFFQLHGETLLYKDAISHLEIAERVLYGPTANPVQLGNVWLPAQHILMLPFVWIPALYFSGIAGSIVSMASYVICAVLVYKIAYSLRYRTASGVVAAAIFMGSTGVLYMQSTAMTELPLFAGMMGMVYGIQRWIQTMDDTLVIYKNRYLVMAAVAAFLATLTRYEAWVLFVVLIIVVAIVGLVKRPANGFVEGTVVGFGILGGSGVLGWMLWCQVYFGNFLGFENGPYAKPSLWVGTGELAVGNLSASFMTYWYATVDNLGLVVVGLMIAGLVAMVIRERRSLLKTLPTISLLALFPFFVAALYLGQRPLHVEQLTHELYNVRFGLLMILPASLLIGYLASLLPRRKAWDAVTIGVAIALVGTFGVIGFSDPTNNIVTLKEPSDAMKTGYTTQSDGASAYLHAHYKNGKILMESFGNELVLFKAGLTPVNNVYEGSYLLWEPALRNPAGSHIKWIVMRHTSQPDEVFTDLYGKVALDSYTRVYANAGYYIYERKS
jgi:hypothetical protein